MKIKNNTLCNQSVMCLKSKLTEETQYITIVGEATLELDDKVWKANEDQFKAQLDAGTLEIVEAAKLSAEEQEEADAKALADAEALVAKANAKKAKPATAPAKATTKS